MNKRKKAAAIAYKPPGSGDQGSPWNDMSGAAPVLAAFGRGRDAEQILAEARKAGIAIVEDPGLAAMLETVKPGDYIPWWCWEAVARILAFVIAKEKD